MVDLKSQYETAVAKAAEYELLGSLAADGKKREKYRCLAEFQYSIAGELRAGLARRHLLDDPAIAADGMQLILHDSKRAP